MSSRNWLAAAALVALAVPAAQAGDRSRVQVTIAPYWGWGGPVPAHPRAVPRSYARGYRDGFRDGRYGGFGGFHPRGARPGPVVRFDYTWRDDDRWYRHDGWRPGGPLRYDGRRDRFHDRDWRGRDWNRRDGGHGRWEGRGPGRDRGWRDD
ncbi:MAG: hypothetical protein MUF07_14815 [Steroidobacteraceae bacterium]|jgi:hypothetical protein|nr:hypothetical protein [Steroidobacteraceae bacterium]